MFEYLLQFLQPPLSAPLVAIVQDMAASPSPPSASVVWRSGAVDRSVESEQLW